MSASVQLVRYDAMCHAIAADSPIITSLADAKARLRETDHCPFPFIPPIPGVYIFDDVIDCRAIYIGESGNLRRRLSHHERGYLRRTPAVRTLILPCCNHKQVERWLIDVMLPVLNGTSGRRRKSARIGFSRDALEAWKIHRFGRSAA